MIIHKLKAYKKKLWGLFLCVFAVPVLLFFLLSLLFPLRIASSYSPIILAADSTVLHASLSPDDKWRLKTELNEISPLLKQTLLYKEDQYFYYHPGFNPLAIGRALFNNLIQGKKTSGASTITMQVARLLEPKKRTIGSKVIELFRALQLEWHYSKDEILQLYINLVPYGGNIEGVKSASVFYFGKLPNHLSLAQITTLTIIPNRPSSLKPGKNNPFLQAERNRWLSRFRDDAIFPEKEIEAALAEPLEAHRLKAPREIPHLARRLFAQYPKEVLIHSTIQPSIQKNIEQLCYNYSQRQFQKRIFNAAILVINNQTMAVEAYIGSPDFLDQEHSGQVDGIKAVRSPGSALKPVVYALGMDEGMITPKSILHDIPTNFDGYAPENFDKKFNGKITVEKALAYSLNIPAVSMLQQVTLPVMLEKLKNAGFKSISRNQQHLGFSLILGGCGVTLEEMTQLYSTFPRAGTFQTIRYLQTDSSSISSQLLSPMAAYMTTEILTQIERPDLPHNYLHSYRVPLIAWKTGTSYGRRDAWSIGYNKKYTIGVWLGNFSGEGAPDLTGADIATPLLFEIFNSIEYSNSGNWFFKPDDLKFRFVCPESGLLQSEHCPHSIVDYYIPNVSSAQKCVHSIPVYVSADNRYSYCTHCLPEGGYRQKLFPNIPSDLLDYYHTQNIYFEEIPTHFPECSRIMNNNAPKIISPLHNKEYSVDKSDPAEMALRCLAHNDVKKVYWYINDEFYKEAFANEKVFFKVPEGKVKISCSDDKGRNTDISISVKFQ
jgi:penicillin-binding protein 1C